MINDVDIGDYCDGVHDGDRGDDIQDGGDAADGVVGDGDDDDDSHDGSFYSLHPWPAFSLHECHHITQLISRSLSHFLHFPQSVWTI